MERDRRVNMEGEKRGGLKGTRERGNGEEGGMGVGKGGGEVAREERR